MNADVWKEDSPAPEGCVLQEKPEGRETPKVCLRDLVCGFFVSWLLFLSVLCFIVLISFFEEPKIGDPDYTCVPGTHFLDDEGCNTCTCMENGKDVGCTDMECSAIVPSETSTLFSIIHFQLKTDSFLPEVESFWNSPEPVSIIFVIIFTWLLPERTTWNQCNPGHDSHVTSEILLIHERSKSVKQNLLPREWFYFGSWSFWWLLFINLT